MIKKAPAVALSIVVIATLVLAMGPFRFQIRKQVKINVALYDISRQFTDLRSWPAWYPVLKDISPSLIKYSENTHTVNSFMSWQNRNKVLITAVNPAAIVVKEIRSDKYYYQSISGIPADNGNTTLITWTKTVNGWQWILEKVSGNSSINRGLNALKKTCEGPEQEHDYNIRIEPVSDTIILTRKITVLKRDRLLLQQSLYKGLLHFLQQQKIPASKNYIYASVLPVSAADSVTIAIGIPVGKRGTNAGETKFLELPANGRLLTATYNGPYKDLHKLSEAMNSYIKSNGMKIVAQTMEQHSGFTSLLNDSMQVELKLIYPVY